MISCQRLVLLAAVFLASVACQAAPVAYETPQANVSAVPSTSPNPQPSATGTCSSDSVPSAAAAVRATATPTIVIANPSEHRAALPKLIAVDPGHGGKDLGARHFGLDGNMDFHESTIVLEIALRLETELRRRGYRVLLVRDGDYLPNSSGEDLNEDGEFTYRDDLLWRVRMINEAGADLLLSLHQNAWAYPDEALVRVTGGCTTYYCPDREFGEDNWRLANLVHERVLAAIQGIDYEPFDRGVQDDNTLAVPGESGEHLILLGPQDDVIKWSSQMPGALNEPFFITCDAEADLMRRDDVQSALAIAYADAVDAYFTGEES